MDSQLLVVVWSALLVIINGQPIIVPEDNNQNFVPGVFISTDVLKDLQEKAQQNQINAQNAKPITNQRKVITNDINTPVNPNENLEQLSDGAGQTTNRITPILPIVSQAQPILSQPAANQPIISNQPIPSQPILSNQKLLPQSQPQILAQQVPNQQPNQVYLLAQQQQPNQAILVQQPSYGQPIMVNQPGNEMLLNQQPGNQLFLSQPPGNQDFNQAGNQMPVNTQVLLQNGQIAQIIPQPYTNQPMFNNLGVVNQNPRTNMPSGATLYAMVPVNGPSSLGVPNTNLGNGNSYMMPAQQQPANQI